MRGATVVDEEGEDATDGFNPRAHAGRDPINWIAKSRILGFNPRAHAGRDVRCSFILFLAISFQSTRPCGARRTF